MRRISWHELKELVAAGKVILGKVGSEANADVFVCSARGHEVGVSVLTSATSKSGAPILKTGAPNGIKDLIKCNPRQKVLVHYNTGPSAGRGWAIVLVKNLKFDVYGGKE